MRVLLIIVTGILVGVTLWSAAFGVSAGVLLVGLALSIAGIFMIAVTGPDSR